MLCSVWLNCNQSLWEIKSFRGIVVTRLKLNDVLLTSPESTLYMGIGFSDTLCPFNSHVYLYPFLDSEREMYIGTQQCGKQQATCTMLNVQKPCYKNGQKLYHKKLWLKRAFLALYNMGECFTSVSKGCTCMVAFKDEIRHTAVWWQMHHIHYCHPQ